MTPTSAAEAQRHLEDLASPVGAFVRDRCRVDPDLVVDKDDLWERMEGVVHRRGHPSLEEGRARPQPPRLGTRCRSEARQRDGKRVHVITGIGLGPTIDGIPDIPDAEVNQ